MRNVLLLFFFWFLAVPANAALEIVCGDAMRGDPSGRVIEAELAQIVREGIDKLPGICADVARLHFLRGLRRDVIARRLEINITTVYSCIAEALPNLTAYLTPYVNDGTAPELGAQATSRIRLFRPTSP